MKPEDKTVCLENILKEMDTVLVAYSGGVDSTFLAYTASEVLGSKMLAVFACSPVYSPEECEEAEATARKIGFRYKAIERNEMKNPDFTANPPDRCYYCRKELHEELRVIASAERLDWIADGTNYDDLKDYRPGRRASLESGVRSPLCEAGLTKEEIRQLSREKGLSTWDKPASPCLASRIPYGTRVTLEILHRIAEGERYLHSLGLRQFRLRHHGDIARIEIEAKDMALILKEDIRHEIVKRITELGYRYAALDLAGFRSGSLNAGIIQNSGQEG